MGAITSSDSYQDQIISSHFAVLDYIPFVSIVSGVARNFFGAIQTTVGVILLPVELISRMSGKHQSLIAVQGIANMIRGTIACKPIGGNIVLFLYDHSPHTKSEFQKAVGIIV
ncbi:MAG TPA: hypothetical protein VLE96_01420 [Chlamydiales bacterium]|nr:hypothetical protein [Chlamydiales bacterium]